MASPSTTGSDTPPPPPTTPDSSTTSAASSTSETLVAASPPSLQSTVELVDPTSPVDPAGPGADASNTSEDDPTINEDVIPGEFAISEGSTHWVIAVAGASNPYDPILTDAIDELAVAGYDSQITNCDVGAAEALRMSSEGTFTVSAYFENEDDARRAETELDLVGIDGQIAEITVACSQGQG